VLAPRLRDQLAPGQVEALYVILRSMVEHTAEAGAAPGTEENASPGASAKHRFSFIGIMDAEPGLAERSAQILRDELGNSTT
jgi:hypothetical protein